MHSISLVLTHTAPSGVPQNIIATPESAYSAILFLSPPPVEDQNGIIIAYVINVTENDTGDTFQLTATTTIFTINNLKPYHNYTCVIAAETSVGLGPFSGSISFRTHEDGKTSALLAYIDMSSVLLLYIAQSYSSQ